MSVRAGIVVTGTEVLTGRITDANGPWVSTRLLELGVEIAHITICGDRPDDMLAQVRFLVDDGVDLIVTTGGLGPTADDLTVPTIAGFAGRELRFDDELDAHIESIIRRWQQTPPDAALPESTLVGIHKQAMVPRGAQFIPPTGTAPGIAIPATSELPAVLILPGPPRELQAMWPTALASAPIAAALADRDTDQTSATIRAWGLREAQLAESLREAETAVPGFDDLEVTTCMRGGEIDMVTRIPAGSQDSYNALLALLLERHGHQIFSTDGATMDELLAEALSGRTIVTAESCTGGMVAARLTDRPGSSAHVLGGVVSYSNDVKIGSLGVPPELIDELGAVSEPVAAAMAEGARTSLGADIAISTTGIAGPDGGSEAKPVGTVCFGLAIDAAPTRTVTRRFPGDRDAVRALATGYALHLVLDALL